MMSLVVSVRSWCWYVRWLTLVFLSVLFARRDVRRFGALRMCVTRWRAGAFHGVRQGWESEPWLRFSLHSLMSKWAICTLLPEPGPPQWLRRSVSLGSNRTSLSVCVWGSCHSITVYHGVCSRVCIMWISGGYVTAVGVGTRYGSVGLMRGWLTARLPE